MKKINPQAEGLKVLTLQCECEAFFLSGVTFKVALEVGGAVGGHCWRLRYDYENKKKNKNKIYLSPHDAALPHGFCADIVTRPHSGGEDSGLSLSGGMRRAKRAAIGPANLRMSSDCQASAE